MLRLYRVALRLYPRAFRLRFARDMEEHFADRLRRDARGRLHAAALGVGLTLQTAAAAVTERVGQPRRSGGSMLHALDQDIRHGARALARRPAFTVVALATLALGIGANTAIFSVVHAVLLRDLPFPDAGRIVRIYETNRRFGFDRGVANPFNFDRWEQETSSFEALAAIRSRSLTLTGAGEPSRLKVRAVTPSFFDVMRVRPLLGRSLSASDAGGSPVVLLSHELWRDRFGADASLIGRSLTLESEPFEVVGVMPAGFSFPYDADAWVPLALTAGDRANMSSWYLSVVGRLIAASTLDMAQAELDAISARLERAFPKQRADRGARVVGLHEDLTGQIAGGLTLLQGIVIAVLLIACANVANLLLAQGVARSREFSIRSAVGAGRGRLVRQLLIENLMLAFAGAALGLLLAVWGARALVAWSPQTLPDGVSADVMGWPLVFTAGVAVLTAVFFGALPMMAATRSDVVDALRNGGRSGTARRGAWVRGGLVAVEVMIAVVLLAGSGLLISSFARLVSQDIGFVREGVVTAHVSLPESRYAEPPARARFWATLFERLEDLPGVTAATGSTALPFSNWDWQTAFTVEGREDVPNFGAGIRAITPGYFATLGIPLLAGREFTPGDVPGSERAVIVNESFVRAHLAGLEPLGHRVATTSSSALAQAGASGATIDTAAPIQWSTIVGVVRDSLQFGLDHEAVDEIYQPLAQQPPSMLTLAVRTSTDTSTLAAALKPVIAQIDAGLPVEVSTLDTLVERTTATRRFYMWLLSLFGAIALLLAVCGIYGVTSFSAGSRLREIAIRLALGARPARVKRLVVREGLTPVFVGLAAGLPLALIAARLLESQLFMTSTRDLPTLATVGAVLIAAAAAACWIPARRSARIAPIEALRSE